MGQTKNPFEPDFPVEESVLAVCGHTEEDILDRIQKISDSLHWDKTTNLRKAAMSCTEELDERLTFVGGVVNGKNSSFSSIDLVALTTIGKEGKSKGVSAIVGVLYDGEEFNPWDFAEEGRNLIGNVLVHALVLSVGDVDNKLNEFS